LGDIHIDKWTCGLAVSTLQFFWMVDVQRSHFSLQKKEKEKKKKNIPANKFDKFRVSKGKIVYYGTQAEKECTFALIRVHL
jgi:hypothetical protein